MDRYKIFIFLAALTSLLLLSTAFVDHAAAQFGARPATDESGDQLSERVFLPPDRAIRQLLDRAEQLLARERYSEAAQALHSVLNSKEDYFFRPPDVARNKTANRTFRSLKSEARRLIGQLPEGGRRSYDLQYGPAARRKLDQAVTEGDMEAVAEVSRRFCHTEAAHEALILLGRYHLDQSRPLAAALCLEQVQRAPAGLTHEPGLSLLLAASWARAGQPEKSAIVLRETLKRWPDVRAPLPEQPDGVALASRPVDQWVAEWTGDTRSMADRGEKEWTIFLGSASRTASAVGGRPLTLRPSWRQRVAVEPSTEEPVVAKARQLFDQSVAAVPAMYPLAIGDAILMRTSGRLAAVNIDTGKILWQTVPELIPSSPAPEPDELPAAQEQPVRASGVPERIWNDKTIGTISSDGELVYVIEKPGTAVEGKGRYFIDPFGRKHHIPETAMNVLSAYEVRHNHGKRRWHVGGPGSVEPKLEQVLFLGPPLPLQGRLYAIAEMAGEVRLLVLAAETGRVQWSQQLAVADDEIARDSSRYGAGISPSFADGVLVCPTTAGAVVAIDQTTRNLLWGYQYPRDAAVETMRDPFAQFIRRQSAGPADSVLTGWRDSCPMIDGGRVIITPAESSQLHCLSLETGQLEWKLDRQTHIYAAAVHSGKVVVVSQDAVSAVPLTGPRRGQVSSTIPLPEGSLPNGRGCYTGRDYYLPLLTATGAEIARVDLDQGKLAERIACRDGVAPGNLLCYRGRMISQGPDWLQCYHQLDVLKQRVDAALAAKPDDPWAMNQRAQMLIEERNPTDALPLLRRAYQTYTRLAEQPGNAGADPAQRRDALTQRIAVRELLVDGLLEHLKTHFDERESVSQELAGLIDQPDERIRYLRIVAEGLGRAGDSAGAMANYFQLIGLAGDGSQTVSADPAHSARLDRWLAARLGALSQNLTKDQETDYDRRVSELYRRASGKQAESVLRLHAALFGEHPSVQSARLRLATGRETPENILERERWLKLVADSEDDAASREATARLALLLEKGERPDAAAVYYRRLMARWTDVPCLAGRTGRQLFEALPSRSPIRKPLAGSPNWPFGAIKATHGSVEARYPGLGYQPAAELVMAGPPPKDALRVFLDTQQQQISGLDGLGNAQWRIPLARDADGSPLLVNRGLAIGRFDGHILLLSFGTHVMAINTLNPGGPNGQGVLWLDESGAAATGGAESRAGNEPRPWDDEDPSHREFGQPLAQLGPVVAGGATYLRSRELVSVDPLTGRRLWSRRDVPAGSELFGDDALLLAAPPQGTEALMMQAVDGTFLGRRKVPPAADRFTTLGRKIVCIGRSEAKSGGSWRDQSMRLKLFDPWTQRTEWELPLEPGTKAALVDSSTAALLNRQGRFLLLDLQAGKPISEQTLDAEPRLAGLHVVASREVLILIANRPQEDSDSERFEPAHENGGPMINGRVYAIDRRTGKSLWPAAATVENFALVLEQPLELPVVLFARRTQGSQKTSFLFLDKRTGALATPTRDYNRRINSFELVGDLEKKTATLHLRSMASTLTLSFTTETAPPEPPLQEIAGRARASKSGSAFGEALKELGKAVKELQKPPADRAQQEKDLFGDDP